MPLSRPGADKLAAYLSQRSPDVAVFLIREIELHRLDGKDDPAYGPILDAARDIVRESDVSIDRLATPLRLFCDPFADLLVDDTWGASHAARISRTSIEPVWSWLLRDRASGRIVTLAGRLKAEARGGPSERVDRMRRQLIASAAMAIHNALTASARSDKARGRLEMMLGGRHPLSDAAEMAAAFRCHDAIVKLRRRLPRSIANLAGDALFGAESAVKEFRAAVPDRHDIGYGVLLARLEFPPQALRLAVHELQTDDSERIAESAFAPLGSLLLFDTETAARQVDVLVRERAPTADVLNALSRFHRYAEGFDAELEINARGRWGNALASARRVASQALDAEIRRVPETIVSLFKPHLGRMKGHPGPAPDLASVEQAERSLTLSRGCRPFLDQLSLNEAVMRFDQNVQARLKAIADAVVDEVRCSSGGERKRAEEWLGVVVSLVRIAQGERDAALLARSAEVARQGSVADGSASAAAG